MSAITIENDLVHYEVLGRGRPVIFVHGWLGSWRYWVPTMQQLSVKYRTYALDLWGFGDSGKESNRYTFKDQVQLLYEFMDKLGIAKAALIGHSLGAAVCLRFASMYPDRAPRVALISAPIFDLGGLDDNPMPVRVAAPVTQSVTTPAATPAPVTSGTAPVPPTPATPPPSPTPVAPSAPANTETIARNPFKGMGESPEEILARLQAKNMINSANVTTAAQQPKPPSAPALPTGIGTPIIPKQTAPLTPPAATPEAAPTSTPAAATPPASGTQPTGPTAPTVPPVATPPASTNPVSTISATPDATPVVPATLAASVPVVSPAPIAPTTPAPVASLPTPSVPISTVPVRTDAPNPLVKYLSGKPSELLSKYVAADAPDLDKLMAEVKKTDEAAISKSTVSFNGVNLAVELQRLPSPTLLLHGKEDPVIPAPADELLERINKGKPTGHLLAFVEPDIRHFPMLEITNKFNRLLLDFLEAADLSNVQFKDQWRRTMR